MKKIIKIGIALIITTSTIGCEKIVPELTIDTTTDELMKSTLQEVRESLAEPDKDRFDEALNILAFSQVDMKSIISGGAAGAANIENKMKESIHGKTAQQIIAAAERIKLERGARERTQAIAKIQELNEKAEAAFFAKTQLEKFEVLRSRFYQEEQEYSGKQPIIEITVKNGTSSAISRVYFEGTVASQDRSVPWHKDTFNYSISGGLEPGEEQSWRLAPNMFSDWGKVNAPKDAIFTVEVLKVDGADGKSLYSTTDFTERDKERLEKLKSKYGV